jgi:integrase
MTLAWLLDEMQRHLDQFAGKGESGRVFVGGKGGMLRRQNFRKIWLKAVAESGVPAVHIHDLRHTGNTLVAENGATLRELMERMGHASTRAALIYLHVSKGRSKHLADGLSTLIDGPGVRGSPNERARGGHEGSYGSVARGLVGREFRL